MSEPLNRLLAALPQAEPDSRRTARTRMKCRAVLQRQASRAVPRSPASRGSALPVWELLMAVLGAAYLTEFIVQALNVYGVL